MRDCLHPSCDQIPFFLLKYRTANLLLMPEKITAGKCPAGIIPNVTISLPQECTHTTTSQSLLLQLCPGQGSSFPYSQQHDVKWKGNFCVWMPRAVPAWLHC